MKEKTLHELAKEFPNKTYVELEKYRDADRQEEAQQISLTESHSGYLLCSMYFSKAALAGRSKQIRYEHYKRIVNEIDRRGLDCRSFPDFDHKEDFIRDRIEKFEKDGTW